MIYTTKGELPDEAVELRQVVTADNDDHRVVRTDKYLKATGEWVGNDLHVHIKKPLTLEGVAGQFS